MKDFPSYKILLYYHSDKRKTDKLDFSDYEKCCGSLLYTENRTFYFSPFHGSYIIPDHISDTGELVPYEWFNENAIKWAMEDQPFDDKDKWLMGRSMYSKDLFKNLLIDIKKYKRSFTIDEVTEFI